MKKISLFFLLVFLSIIASAQLKVHNGGVVSILGKALALSNKTSNPDSASNGWIFYNSATNQFMGYRSNVWTNFLTSEDIAGGNTSGHIVYVDKDNPAATNARTGLSRYSVDKPFKTIYAASQVLADGDVLIIQPGIYTDSLVTTTPKYIGNAVYFNNVTLNGDIKMSGKIYVTNTILNSTVYFDLFGTDFNNGNALIGLDKGISVLNGRFATRTTSPGGNNIAVRNLAKIITPSTTTGATFGAGNSNTKWVVSDISLIQNLSTSYTICGFQNGSMSFTDIGKITGEYNGNTQMLYGNPSFLRVGLVEYKGTSFICGGYQSGFNGAEQTTFKTTAATYMFATYAGSLTYRFKRCAFINTAPNGYIVRLANAPTNPAQNKSMYFKDCEFQVGANYLLNITGGIDLQNVHLINCISNNTSNQFMGGTVSTQPVVSIINNYVYDPAFTVQY